MTPIPKTWTTTMKERFKPLQQLFDIEGLYDFFPMVHVCGTNGKGSVCAFLMTVLQKAGYKVGVFTSPHLFFETERIVVNNTPIPQSELDLYLDEAYGKNKNLKLFEAYFYAALCYFKKNEVDVAVIEAGVGGKMDCTNIIQSTLTICTSIGIDHINVLGTTLEEIAVQKAGIAKPNVPMVLYPVQEESAREVFTKECNRLEGKLFDLKNVEILRHVKEEKQTISATLERFVLPNTTIALRGKHQSYNAVTAAYAAMLLNKFGFFHITMQQIQQGLEHAAWRGRFEKIASGPDVYIDGAHNVDGVKALLTMLEEYLKNRRIILIVAMMETKQIKEMADLFSLATDCIITTQADKDSGVPADELACYFENAIPINDPKEALFYAQGLCSKEDVIVAAGSLYLPSKLGL